MAEEQVVAISTKMGSLSAAGKKPYLSAPYRITKAAENMAIRLWARDPAASGVTYVMLHPGHVSRRTLLLIGVEGRGSG